MADPSDLTDLIRRYFPGYRLSDMDRHRAKRQKRQHESNWDPPRYRRPILIDRLPIELNQQIALFIKKDRDLLSFAKSCRSGWNAVDGDEKHFWRCRFAQTFDPPDWPDMKDAESNNDRFKNVYTARQSMLSDKGFAGFAFGFHKIELDAAKLIRELLLEAGSGAVMKNLDVVLQFVGRLKHFSMFNGDELTLYGGAPGTPRDRSFHWMPLLLMLQCMLAPFYLGTKNKFRVLGFPDSQAIAYASSDKRPFFLDGTINFETVAHHVNFWTGHLVKDGLGSIRPFYAMLGEHERPSFWRAQLKEDHCGLPEQWMGTYAYLTDERYFTHGPDGLALNGVHLEDEFLGEGQTSPFQELELRICTRGELYWPELFEQFIPTHNIGKRTRTRAQGRSIQEPQTRHAPQPIVGRGIDQGAQFFMSGWLKQMPNQMEVPGWRRLTLMKYYVDEDTGVVNDDGLWAYEGVVHPGAGLVTGRWFYPTVGGQARHAYRGPFILWAINAAV